MAHLNELVGKYHDRGFNVLAVSHEDKLVIERYMRQIDPRMSYPIAVGGGEDYGVTTIPAAYLIGGDGKVVWEGTPGSLSDKLIEEHLHKLPKWGRMGGVKAQAAGKVLDQDGFGKAHQLASEILAADGAAREDIDAATAMIEHVKTTGNRRLLHADALVSDGASTQALKLLDDMVTAFSGSEWAEKAAAKRKQFMESELIKVQLAAEDSVAKVLKRIKGNLGEKDCEQYRKAFEKMLADARGSAQPLIKRYVEVFQAKWGTKHG
ncbi:MAG: hypothetical protein U1E76_07170 [Planctomycetota bacterium]